MPLQVATHSGPFHADDVLAWSMIRLFLDPDAHLTRTRDPLLIDQADIVFDVGAVFSPEAQRFDHHQNEYSGPLSSAGMVLNWLESSQRVSDGLAAFLRTNIVNYVDDVDNGRHAPTSSMPCYSNLIHSLNALARPNEDFDTAFIQAGEITKTLLQAMVAQHEALVSATESVLNAMRASEERGDNVLDLGEYVKWKDAYFRHGGAEHITEFAIYPNVDGNWALVAIPPEPNSFDKKVALPDTWSGLRDQDLCDAAGVPDAIFCHKNLFLAIFKTKESTLFALKSHGLFLQK